MIDSSKPSRGWLATLASCMGTEADRRNQLWVAGGIIAWALVYVVTNEAMQHGASPWLILIPAAIVMLVVMAYLRFLRQTDEYVRLMQIQGLAVGFGLSFFIIAIIEALGKAGFNYDIAHETSTVILVSWAAGQMLVAWHHR